MPVVGTFHSKYWRARANGIIPPGKSNPWMYPQWQPAVIAMAVFGPPLDLLKLFWARAKWWMRWQRAIQGMGLEQILVLHRVMQRLTSPEWDLARSLVRTCAHTPDFHHQEAWVSYSRAMRANLGQTQNIFRHLTVIQGLQAQSLLSNPEAHLLAQLAYEGFAAVGRPHRIIPHAARLLEHPKKVMAR